MTTEKYISFLLDLTGSQKTPAQMLDLVNIAQNEIFSINTYFNQVKPASSLFINTTSEILQYTISDPLIRQVSRVYLPDPSAFGDAGYVVTSIYDNFGWYWNGFGFSYGNNDYDVTVPVQVTEALEVGDNVTVFFERDPGTSTEQVFYDAYTWPQNGQLTSNTVPLSLPEKIQTKLLFSKVAKMLEIDKDGRSIFSKQEVDDHMKDYLTFANQGAKIEDGTPVPWGV